MNTVRIALMIAACGVVSNAQSWDTTGNGMLNGTYYFREVILTSSEAASIYGNIVFNGNGAYTISAVAFDCTSSCGLSPYQASGTYSIAASGFGFLSNAPLGSPTFGSVGANGVFVGATTESGVNDLFIAAPVSGQATGTLQGTYSVSYLTPNLFSQTGVPFGALLQFSSNGGGSIGNVSVAAYQISATSVNQTIGGVKYIVSNNAFKVTFPNSNTNFITGDEYVYSTPDGSFVFGGSPQDFDMLVGVRTGTSGTTALSGLYYEAGMDIDNSAASSGSVSLDTFYGSFNAASSVIVGHERIQDGSDPPYGYVYHDTYPVQLSGTYQDIARSRGFIVGGGVRIGVGIGPFPALTVAVQAPKVASGSGMFLDPTSAVNTASDAPFTTGISSGELLTLMGLNLGPSTLAVAGTTPLPTTLAGVQVVLNSRAIPILEASSTQIIAQVPYQTTAGTALIQVLYKGAQSNTISTLVNSTTPGVFTIPIGGVNRASARHLNGTLVTPASPAKVGETVTVYLTGLGDVSPNVVDGGVGPTLNPAKPVNPFNVFIDGIAATPSFLGLAPGLVALYQMKVAIPAGVTAGDVFLEVAGPDSYSSQATISVTSSTTGTANRRGRPHGSRRFIGPGPGVRRIE